MPRKIDADTGKGEPKWLSCKVCLDQVTDHGPRCLQHNPEPVDDRPLTRKESNPQ